MKCIIYITPKYSCSSVRQSKIIQYSLPSKIYKLSRRVRQKFQTSFFKKLQVGTNQA